LAYQGRLEEKTNTSNQFKNNFMSTTFNFRRTAITMALLLTLGISYGFANPSAGPVRSNDEISIAFSKSFRHAQIISKEMYKTYTKFTFRMNDMVMFAYYSYSGELLAVTRNILSTQLPIDLLVDLKTGYSKYWITELFELSGDGRDSYYVTLENADIKIVLRSTGDNWEVYSKAEKE
jgi:hypothetical protein